MEFVYLENLHQAEIRRLLKKLVPRAFVLAYFYCRHRQLFPGSFVSAGSKVIGSAKIGKNCVIQESVIGANTTIGNFTTVNHNCRFGGGGAITVGKYCSIAPECLFWAENHNPDLPSAYPHEHLLTGKNEKWQEYISDDIVIGNDVWIGQRATVLAGARVGDGCIVAAGAVVPAGEYRPYSLIGGVPAKIIRDRFNPARVKELLELRWWDKMPEDIFGGLMDFLHRPVK